MNECLENLPSGEVISLGKSPTPDDAAEFLPGTADGQTPKKGRVLLLEDDPLFKDGVRDFLAENGYEVVAVDNGTDGVREALTGDFALILCDMRMPKVSGEMFYRAVERIRPELCGRFVFMTGYDGDEETTDFIERVSGFLLRKPFRFDELLDWIEVASVFGVRGTVTERASGEPVAPQPCSRADALPGARSDDSREGPGMAACTLIDPTPAPVPAPDRIFAASRQTAGGSVALEPEIRAARGSGLVVFVGLALVLLLGTGLWNRYRDARDSVTSAAAARAVHEAEWEMLSGDLQKAVAVRSRIELDQSQRARISEDRATPRWTSALSGILTAGSEGIELLAVRARGGDGDSGSCEVRVQGVARGGESRLLADRFRHGVEDHLKAIANGRPVSTRFERLDDVPGAQPDQRQADFVMIATFGPTESPAAGGKEER